MPVVVVLDTNVLVAASFAPRSASRRIVSACMQGTLTAAVSEELIGEYEHICPKATQRSAMPFPLEQFLEQCRKVKLRSTPRVVEGDPEDDKVVATAVAADAVAIVTSDQHLLDLESYRQIDMLTPSLFAERFAAALPSGPAVDLP